MWEAWLTDDPATQSYLASLLSAEEHARLARFHLSGDRQRFLQARGLLRHLVGAFLDTPAEGVEFGYGAFGKPFVVPVAGVPPIHVNVSHSGELVLLALSREHEVGVDVEEVRRDQDWEAIALRVLSRDEYREWVQRDSEGRLEAFFRAWTRREAGLKAVGRGFASEGDVVPDAGMVWRDLALREGYHGAVAWRPPA